MGQSGKNGVRVLFLEAGGQVSLVGVIRGNGVRVPFPVRGAGWVSHVRTESECLSSGLTGELQFLDAAGSARSWRG